VGNWFEDAVGSQRIAEEVERCIGEVMDGEEYRKNVAKWMAKAKEAMNRGGTSDRNIAEFAAKYLSSY
jgi:hypothetical protein